MESSSGSSIMALRSVDGSAIESPEGFPLVAILAAPGGAGVGFWRLFQKCSRVRDMALLSTVGKGVQCGESELTDADPRAGREPLDIPRFPSDKLDIKSKEVGQDEALSITTARSCEEKMRIE